MANKISGNCCSQNALNPAVRVIFLVAGLLSVTLIHTNFFLILASWYETLFTRTRVRDFLPLGINDKVTSFDFSSRDLKVFADFSSFWVLKEVTNDN
jgi:hypothetical protein